MAWISACGERVLTWHGGAMITLLLLGVTYANEMTDPYDMEFSADIGNEVMASEQAKTLLQRHRREVSWDSIEEFYDDKNNFAMYLVLPIIVIVYGGCAVIYCIARCRRYMKQKNKKAKQKDQQSSLEEEPREISGSDGARQPHAIPSNRNVNPNPIPIGGAQARDGAHSSSEVRISMEQDSNSETPLPWQVPGDKEPLYSSKAAMATNYPTKQSNTFTNKSFSPDGTGNKPPPAYDDMYARQAEKHGRPNSKPPPYEERRRGSVEEIITLDPVPVPVPVQDFNDRKRRRPGSRTGIKSEAQRIEDMERDKARQLVRGDRPRRDVAPEVVGNRDKTPDIISHARTRPLEPSYKPTMNNAQPDPSQMARQAAQLLRLDHIGKTTGKKPKRLVFVAE